jgi:hypothetical protein
MQLRAHVDGYSENAFSGYRCFSPEDKQKRAPAQGRSCRNVPRFYEKQ